MPSPFPGMDPYLEGPLWTSVHSQLGAEIARQLAPKISPRYIAWTTERFVMDTFDEIHVTTSNMYPDVELADTGGGTAPVGAVALAAPLQLATPIPTPVPHVSVEIRDTAERRLVTAIELLSPTNKRGEGRGEYLMKRNRILLSPAHLVEIDLHREGQRVPTTKALPPARYFVFLSRAEKRPVIWPIPLTEPLPSVPIPLLAGDADVTLDLQLAFTNVYDLCRYDLAADYSKPPVVSLSEEERAYTEEIAKVRLP